MDMKAQLRYPSPTSLVLKVLQVLNGSISHSRY